MAIFNLSNFNYGNTFIRLSDPITPSSYEGIKIYGVGGFGRLIGSKYVYSQEEIDELSGDQPFPDKEWTVDRFILANFDNNLQAGNITSLPSPITKWIVLRKEVNDAKFTKIAEIGAEELSYIDELAKSQSNYTYQLLPVATDVIGSPLEAVPVDTDFNKVVILEEGGDGYSFCLDLRLSETRVLEDISFNETRGQYDTKLRGNRKVHAGSMGTIITSTGTEEELVQNYLYLEQFRDYLLNDTEKILKFTNGFTYRVETFNVALTKKTGVTNKGKEIYLISFEWQEINDL